MTDYEDYVKMGFVPHVDLMRMTSLEALEFEAQIRRGIAALVSERRKSVETDRLETGEDTN